MAPLYYSPGGHPWRGMRGSSEQNLPRVCPDRRGDGEAEHGRGSTGWIIGGGNKHMGRSTRWPYVRRMAWDRDRKARALCWICGQPIDYSLEPSSADTSWEPDHVQPVHMRPDLELDLNNIKASHRACNRSRGDGTNGENVIGQQSRIW